MRRLLLAGVVVVLLAIGATGLGLRDRVDLSATGFTVNLVPFLAVLFVLALGCFVLLLLVGRGPVGLPGGRRPMSRSLPAAMLGMAVAGLLFYLAVTLGPERGADRGPQARPAGPTTTPGQSAQNPGDTAPEPASSSLLIVAALLGIVVVAALLLWWRSRRREQGAPATADDLRRVISEAQQALSSSADPKAAVIAAYEAMERALADAGLDRRIADTPVGLLHRAMASGMLSQAAIEAAEHLTGLFERARYSERPLPEGAKDQATAALARIDADLAAPGSGTDPAVPAASSAPAAGAHAGADSGAGQAPADVVPPSRTEDRG